MKKLKYFLLTAIFTFLFCGLNVYAEAAPTYLDVQSIGAGTKPVHNHLWFTNKSDTQHWQQCSVCGEEKPGTRANHALVPNGRLEDLLLCCNRGGKAYRASCACGYQTETFFAIHGQYENYANENLKPANVSSNEAKESAEYKAWRDSQVLNYSDVSGTRLIDVMQISQDQFNRLNVSNIACAHSNELRWKDDDGDGLGWVFIGGPIIGNSNIKGSVELILGSEGDRGRNHAFDEYFVLTDYIGASGGTSLSGFIQFLKSRVGSNSNHLLAGYISKYQSISAAQWNKLVTIFSGYRVHRAGSIGWNSQNIQRTGHPLPGESIYSDYTCFDSTQNKSCRIAFGETYTCDICGAKFVAQFESWTTANSPSNVLHKLKVGESQVFTESPLTGTLGAPITYTLTAKRTKSDYIISVSIESRSENGIPFTRFSIHQQSGNVRNIRTSQKGDSYVGTVEYSVPVYKSKEIDYRPWGYPAYILFKDKNNNTMKFNFGYYAVYEDDTAPSLTARFTGSGTASNPDNKATIEITCTDPPQYYLNYVTFSLYDENNNLIESKVVNSDDKVNYPCTIEIKKDIKEKRAYKVTATDATGNSTSVPVYVFYVDNAPPTITVSNIGAQNAWSNEKTITVTATDAFGKVWLGICEEDMKFVSSSEYNNSRTYKIIGNENEDKVITFFARDASGNTSALPITFSKLDNATPDITESIEDLFNGSDAVGWKVNVTAADKGCGVTGVALTKERLKPDNSSFSSISNGQTVPFNVYKSGTYYLWTRDLIGNVSEPKSIVIHSDLRVNDTVEIAGIEYGGKDLGTVYYNGKRIRL